jgi:hypothetical protein
VTRAATVAIFAVAIALACHARAQARTEYCPATLWYRPAIPATADGRSSGLVYGLVAGGDSDNLLDAWVYKTSGNREIDRSALAAARASSYKSAVSYCQKADGDYLFRADFEPY